MLPLSSRFLFVSPLSQICFLPLFLFFLPCSQSGQCSRDDPLRDAEDRKVQRGPNKQGGGLPGCCSAPRRDHRPPHHAEPCHRDLSRQQQCGESSLQQRGGAAPLYRDCQEPQHQRLVPVQVRRLEPQPQLLLWPCVPFSVLSFQMSMMTKERKKKEKCGVDNGFFKASF